MAIVAHGLGQPEEGSLVAGGLGVSESDPNALRAVLVGSSAILATLTDGSEPTPEPEPSTTGAGGYYLPKFPTAKPRKKAAAVPAYLSAHLTGTSRLTATPDFAIDPDVLAAELATALLLDLV